MRAVPALLLLIASLLVMTTAEGRVDDLYAAEVTVDGRDTRARNAAFAQALDRVLVKVTGSRDVLADDALAGLRRDAPSLVQQWSYTADGLWAAFDASAINRTLRDARLPEWGSQRPRTLLWVAVDDGAGVRRVLGADDTGPLAPVTVLAPRPDTLPLGVRRWRQAGEVPAWLRAAARAQIEPEREDSFFRRLTRRGEPEPDPQPAGEPAPDPVQLGAELELLRGWLEEAAVIRGLPIEMPRMDLEDRLALTPQHICELDEQRILEASRRYDPDAIVVGCGRLLGENAATRWTLLAADERQQWDGDLAEGVHGAADTLAAALAAVAGSDGGILRMSVHDVASLEDYGRVLRHLEGMSLVQSVTVAAVDGDVIELEVRSRGGRTQLDRALGLGRVLRPDEARGDNGRYRLQR